MQTKNNTARWASGAGGGFEQRGGRRGNGRVAGGGGEKSGGGGSFHMTYVAYALAVTTLHTARRTVGAGSGGRRRRNAALAVSEGKGRRCLRMALRL